MYVYIFIAGCCERTSQHWGKSRISLGALDCRKQICVPIHSFIHDRWRRGKTERKRDAESMRECVRLCTISIGHVSANTHTHTHICRRTLITYAKQRSTGSRARPRVYYRDQTMTLCYSRALDMCTHTMIIAHKEYRVRRAHTQPHTITPTYMHRCSEKGHANVRRQFDVVFRT